jgi:cation diffusion facilitator CzcD-associated flavoprotein CzcO
MADTGRHVRVGIVGAGFAGLGMAIRCRRRGIPFAVFERASDLGGTWRDNSYPGCRCDVPSNLYSFSFALNPDWSHTYPGQGEILAYLRRCAADSGVLPSIQFGEELLDARWDEAARRWDVTTSGGRWTADVLVLGNGPLSEPAVPELPGLETFAGARFHSAAWDHGHDLAGERVAVIGTGASAIQLVPEIQPVVGRLHLFQRTPAWVLPHTDRPTRPLERWLYRHVPGLQRAARAGTYWSRELLAIGFTKNPRLLRPVQRLGLRHLERQVPDPELRAKLTPDFSPGCKRLLLSNDYYPALCAGNVEVVTDRIAEVRERSVVTADGRERDVDTIVFGTGFRVTDNPFFSRIAGRTGRSLRDTWSGGLRAYLGTAVPGFPNLFLLAGPNTGIGHTSLVYLIEAQIAYVLDALRTLERRGASSVEVRPEVCEAFNDGLQERMLHTVWSTGCRSWYLDAQGRNTTLWPDFTWRFRQLTSRFDAGRYSVA